jgi:hypothetical protein
MYDVRCTYKEAVLVLTPVVLAVVASDFLQEREKD